MTLRIANEDNAELLTSSSGIKISAHDHQVSHGIIEDEGVSASLGRETMIQFSKVGNFFLFMVCGNPSCESLRFVESVEKRSG